MAATPPAGSPQIDPLALTAKLQQVFASPSYRPPLLPGVALEVLALSQKANVEFDEVVRVLEHDSILAGRVLAISQSAYYAPRSPILSLRQAAIRLGIKTLRDLVLEAALNLRIFRAPGYDEPMERLRHHSTMTAHLLRVLCKRTEVEADYLFLCGLLHDVGIAASLLAVSESQRGSTPPFDQLGPVLDGVHAGASALLIALWKLPEEIRIVAENHHRLHVNGVPDARVALTILAEQLAYELDAGMAPLVWPPEWKEPEPPPPPLGALDANPPELVEEARRLLRIDDAGMESMRAEALELSLKVGEVPSSKPAPKPAARAR